MIHPEQTYRHPSGAEVRALLTRLVLTHATAARLLSLDERTIRRYVRGDTTMPYPAVHCLISRRAGVSVQPGTWRSALD